MRDSVRWALGYPPKRILIVTSCPKLCYPYVKSHMWTVWKCKEMSSGNFLNNNDSHEGSYGLYIDIQAVHWLMGSKCAFSVAQVWEATDVRRLLQAISSSMSHNSCLWNNGPTWWYLEFQGFNIRDIKWPIDRTTSCKSCHRLRIREGFRGFQKMLSNEPLTYNL